MVKRVESRGAHCTRPGLILILNRLTSSKPSAHVPKIILSKLTVLKILLTNPDQFKIVPRSNPLISIFCFDLLFSKITKGTFW